MWTTTPYLTLRYDVFPQFPQFFHIIHRGVKINSLAPVNMWISLLNTDRVTSDYPQLLMDNSFFR